MYMNPKKTGRKLDFPNQSTRRIAIILPEDTVVKLGVKAAKSMLSRNQIIDLALQAYLKEEE